MKKILRYLLGNKGSSPSLQKRSVPAHELALKAVLRRRSGESEKGEAQERVTGELPVAAEQPVPVDQQASGPSVGETPQLPSKKQQHAERTQRRQEQSLVAGRVASVGTGAVGPGGDEAPPLLSKKQRHAERKRRRQLQSLVASQGNLVGKGEIGPGG